MLKLSVYSYTWTLRNISFILFLYTHYLFPAPVYNYSGGLSASWCRRKELEIDSDSDHITFLADLEVPHMFSETLQDSSYTLQADFKDKFTRDSNFQCPMHHRILILNSESFSLAGFTVLITEFDVILAVQLSLISISVLKGQTTDYIQPHTALSNKHSDKEMKLSLVVC